MRFLVPQCVATLRAGTDSQGGQALMGDVEYLAASLSVLNTTVVSHESRVHDCRNAGLLQAEPLLACIL